MLSRLVAVFALFGAGGALDNGVGRAPALGWSSWNYFEHAINQSLIHDIAAAMVSTGLRDAGFQYVNLDAGVWLPNRTSTTGELQPNLTLFPDGIKALADHLHGMKLKLGLYINLGTDTATCGKLGSYGHYEKDAATLAGFGVDYIKVDYCSYPKGVWTPPIPTQLGYWQQLRDAFNKTKRPIWLNFCPRTFGGSLVPPDPKTQNCLPNQRCIVDGPAHVWDAKTRQALANSILTEFGNSHDAWSSAMSNLDALLQLRPVPDASGPGFFSDGDMLQSCNFGKGRTGGDKGGMKQQEYQAQFAVWAVLASPMIISADLRSLAQAHPDCLAMLKSPEVLAVNQDPAAHAPVRFMQTNVTQPGSHRVQIAAQGFSRRMHDGSVAVALLNRGDAHSKTDLTVEWEKDLGLPAGVACEVRDLIGQKDLPKAHLSYTASLGSHEAALVRVRNCAKSTARPRIEMHRDWAPRGYDRFLELVKAEFFDNQIVYRVIPGFLVQFGVAADPSVQARWQNDCIPDDPKVDIPFTKGTISFAGNGVDSRSSHLFISDSPHGDSLGSAHHERPFGRIEDVNEQAFLDNCSNEYGDITHLQDALVKQGNEAATAYPKLTRIKTIKLVRRW
eukprot:g85.t1